MDGESGGVFQGVGNGAASWEAWRMAIRVARRMAEQIKKFPGSILVQVQDASDPEAAGLGYPVPLRKSLRWTEDGSRRRV